MKLQLTGADIQAIIQGFQNMMPTGSSYEFHVTTAIMNAVVTRLLKKLIDRKAHYKLTLNDFEVLAIHRALSNTLYSNPQQAVVGNAVLSRLDQYVNSHFE